MMYETTEDRQNQDMAIFQYTRHLQNLGVEDISSVPTKADLMAHFDFEVWIQGFWTTVVEVRCINYSSEDVAHWGHLLMDMVKLTSLKKEFSYKSKVTKKTTWDKRIIFLFRCNIDSVCYAISMERIIEVWPKIRDADQGMMKSNHGSDQHSKAGKLIPIQFMDKFI